MFKRTRFKIVSAILASTFVLGNGVVMAYDFTDESAALAVPIDYNTPTTVHLDGEDAFLIYSFVPEKTAIYDFNSYDLTYGDIEVGLWVDDEGDSNNDGTDYDFIWFEWDIGDWGEGADRYHEQNVQFRALLEAGRTYYYKIDVEEGSGLDCKVIIKEWDPITVEVTGPAVVGGISESSYRLDIDDFQCSYQLQEGGDYTITINNPADPDGDQYEYTWEDGNNGWAEMDVDGTSFTSSDPNGEYLVNIKGPTPYDDFSIYIYMSRDYHLQYESPDTEYYLTEVGRWIKVDPAFTVDDDVPVIEEMAPYEPHVSRYLADVESDFTEDIYDRRIPSGVVFPDGLNGFLAFKYQISLNGVTYDTSDSDVTTAIVKPIDIFVLNRDEDGNLITDGTLVADEAMPVEVDNGITSYGEWPRYLYGTGDLHEYVYQRIYSYTPEENGTITLSVSDIERGIPTIVLFNHNYAFLGAAGGDEYYDRVGSSIVRQPEFELRGPRGSAVKTDGESDEYEVTLQAEVVAGKTYYIAVPIFYIPNGSSRSMWYMNFENTSNADYDITLSFEAGEISDPSTADIIDESAINTDDPDFVWTDPSASETTTTPTPAAEVPTTVPTTVPDQTDNGSLTPENNNPEVVTPSDNTVDDFVGRLYSIALGREADDAGLQDWVDAVTVRGETGADVARGFLYSPEFINMNVSNAEFVSTLYRTFFGREADEGGLNAWVAVLDGGESRENVIEGFINSTEWSNTCLMYGIRSGGTGVPSIEVEPNSMTIEFATRLYTTCLGREADEPGLMAWARQLANQRDTGTGAAYGFFFSEEFMNQNVSNTDFVNRLYRTFMGREADEDGFNAWVAQLDSGVSREEVFYGFADSPEFGRICAAYGIIR